MLIFGLGNLTYPKTRHSVGQLIIDGLAAKFNARLQYESKIKSYTAEARDVELPISGSSRPLTLTFAKTNQFMNLSGPAVKKTIDDKLHNVPSFHSKYRKTIIIHDSIDQAPMKVSPRFGGSARGHNGIRSVIASLGTQDFHRIRIGIGAAGHGLLEQYVLERMSPKELEYWSPGGEGIETVWNAILKIIEDENKESGSKQDGPSNVPSKGPTPTRGHKQKRKYARDDGFEPGGSSLA